MPEAFVRMAAILSLAPCPAGCLVIIAGGTGGSTGSPSTPSSCSPVVPFLYYHHAANGRNLGKGLAT